MKYTLLIAVLMSSQLAFATEKTQPVSNAPQQQEQLQQQKNITDIDMRSGVRNPIQIPTAASAIAPNVSLYGCLPVIVGSEAYQNPLWGKSKTTKPDIVAFCAALAVGDLDTARQVLCNVSDDYRNADAQLETPRCAVQQDSQ